MRLQPLFSQEDMVPRKEVVIRQHSSPNAMPLPPQNNSVSLLRLVRESRWLSPPGGLRSLTEHEHVSTSWWQRTGSLASLSTLRLDNVATTTATPGRKRRVPVPAWVVPLSMTT